jgi:hypothetical protein
VDLNYGDDSKVSIEKYSREIDTIYNQYSAKLVSLQTTAGLKNISIGPEFASSMTQMGNLYGETATKLKKVVVPKMVAREHLELVNTYLKNAAAAFSMARTEDDPTKAFAGLVMLSNSTDQETLLWAQIQEILNKN